MMFTGSCWYNWLQTRTSFCSAELFGVLHLFSYFHWRPVFTQFSVWSPNTNFRRFLTTELLHAVLCGTETRSDSKPCSNGLCRFPFVRVNASNEIMWHNTSLNVIVHGLGWTTVSPCHMIIKFEFQGTSRWATSHYLQITKHMYFHSYWYESSVEQWNIESVSSRPPSGL